MIYIYRTTENDDEGDPLDHGIVSAYVYREAVTLVKKRLKKLGHSVGFKLYPQKAPGLSRCALEIPPGLFEDIAPPMTFDSRGNQLETAARPMLKLKEWNGKAWVRR